MGQGKVVVKLAFLFFSAIASAKAQSLTVSPLAADLAPGNVSSVFTLETSEKEGVAVQVRVFRWSQADGADKLEKTDNVVISPPVLTVHAGSPSTLRLVRVAKSPVSGEETYRVLIDQIPDRKKQQAGTIALRITQSLPVFFAGVDANFQAHSRGRQWNAVTGASSRLRIVDRSVSGSLISPSRTITTMLF